MSVDGQNSFAARPARLWVAVGLCIAAMLAWSLPAAGASMTATLDRDTVTVGESATLTITFDGGEPDRIPAVNAGPNVRIQNLGLSRNVSIADNRVQTTITQTYGITPLQEGVFQIPALQATIQGQAVSSQPVRLTALKAGQSADNQTQLAFMRIVMPQKQAFVGQAIPVELQVFVRDGVLNAEEILRAFDNYNGSPITAEGCKILRTGHANRRRAQVGGGAYTFSTLVTAISPVKDGKLKIESIKVPLTLQLPVGGQRRRDIFDPFGMFQQSQAKEMVLVATPETLDVSLLPSAGAPPGFNGAVGSFSLKAEAGPTNVAVGDPVTVRVRIEGRGDLDALALPGQDWRDFKTYPPSSKLETTDPLGLQGARIFEQVVVPQSEQIKELPEVSFSFFDPEKKAYQVLKSHPVPLTVRPGGSTPAPVVAVPQSRDNEPSPAPDLVPIKRKLGAPTVQGVMLITRPGFLLLQLVPVVALLGAAIWRKRKDALASNPRLLRKREVAAKVRAGLGQLRTFAAQNNSDEFFLTVFRLLQEQIGERLDVPASSITEAVVDERLSHPAVAGRDNCGAPAELLGRLRTIFQQCDQARYAPVRSSQQLEALIPQIEGVLNDLRALQV